jgi:DNA-binding MarR family transcriptional regulator
MAVDTGGGLLRPDGPPLTAQARELMSENAYRDCLITVRSMLHDGHRAIGVIDSTLAHDRRALLRCRIGEARLTKRQWDILGEIDRYSAEHDMAPTLQELGDSLGISKVCVYEHLKALAHKGVIGRRVKHAARSLYIIDRSARGPTTSVKQSAVSLATTTPGVGRT